jgi:hypothetical protein
MSIFEILENSSARPVAPPTTPGQLDIDRTFRELISESLRKCNQSRYQVAARMSELVGQDITKTMLDSWTAESKELHRFPAIYLPAFCEAVGSTEPIRILGQAIGAFVLPGPEALRAEIRKLDEEIERKRSEKRKRVEFLKTLQEAK